MSRTFEDALGVEWEAFLEPVDDPTGTVDEEVILHLRPDDGSDEREIRVVGPAEEGFEELSADALRLAVDAAGAERGFLFLHPEGEVWWVRQGSDDVVAEGALITFTGIEDELRYSGTLAGDPSTLAEEELLEILDEARGITSP